jgi:hypothetical protein
MPISTQAQPADRPVPEAELASDAAWVFDQHVE